MTMIPVLLAIAPVNKSEVVLVFVIITIVGVAVAALQAIEGRINR